MKITPTAIARLRKRLPRGYQRLAHERLGGIYGTTYIGYVANGQRTNRTVLEVLIALAEEHERETARLNARAKGLTH